MLFGHDCVIIPGFGGFIGNYSPARIDKKSGTFYPPVKQISFNRNLNHNDGLLVGKISGTSGINYGDARTLVEEFARDLRKRLEKGEKIAFDHIGTFVNNQEGNVQFEPDGASNYHLDSYGLESFQMMPLEGYNVRTRVMPVVKDPARQASMRKILWRAAIIVPLLTVLAIVSVRTDLLKSRVESSNLNPLVTAEFEQNKSAVDAEMKKEQAVPGQANDDLSAGKPETGPETEPPVNTASQPAAVAPSVAQAASVETVKDLYYLVTGSFRSEENALSQVNSLKEEGFTPEIVVAENGFYRVYAMACNDLGTAKIKKDSIAGKFPGAWISRKKQ